MISDVISTLKSHDLWDDKLVYFEPKRIQIQNEPTRDIVGVMLVDIPIREYLEKIEFDFSNKPLFKSIVDEFDEFEWGLRIRQTNSNDFDWHFLINFEEVHDHILEQTTTWDSKTGATVLSETKVNPSSSTKKINQFFSLNPIHTAKTKEEYLANGKSLFEWNDAITNVSFDYNYENDKIGEVFRCYHMFHIDLAKVQEFEDSRTGAHEEDWSPVLGDTYQHIYKTVNGKFVKKMTNVISVLKADEFNDRLNVVESLHPLYCTYSSFSRDDGISGVDVFSN